MFQISSPVMQKKTWINPCIKGSRCRNHTSTAGWWSQASLTQPILLHQENELNSVTLDTVFLNEGTKWSFISSWSWHLFLYNFQLHGYAWRSAELLKAILGNWLMVSSSAGSPSCWNSSAIPSFYLRASHADTAQSVLSYWGEQQHLNHVKLQLKWTKMN